MLFLQINGKLHQIDLILGIPFATLKYVWLPQLLGAWEVVCSFKCISVKPTGFTVRYSAFFSAPVLSSFLVWEDGM